MISVAILINGQPVMARSAVNKGPADNGEHIYHVDDGTYVYHKREDGAAVLAIKLLKTIKEEEEDTKHNVALRNSIIQYVLETMHEHLLEDDGHTEMDCWESSEGNSWKGQEVMEECKFVMGLLEEWGKQNIRK